MGCSNTSNKKKHIINDKLKNNNDQKVSDSAGTNEGRTSDDKTKNSELNKNIKQIEIEEDDNKEIPKGCVEIKVEADTTEQIFPVWVEKDIPVKIYVRGKWSLIPEYGQVNYKGHSNFNYKHRDVNIGALIGRIQGGSYFNVINGMSLNPEVSGPIYFFANNSRFAVQPSGHLNVYLENVKQFNFDQIERMSGWDLNELDTTYGHDYLTKDEKLQIIFLNKIKVDPKLFAQQYLIHLIDLGESYKEIYNKLLHYPSGKLLKPSKALYLAARDHAKDMGVNGTTGHKSTDESDLRSRISRYSNEPSYFGENCSYNLKNALSIVTQLIVDDGFQTRAHRANILNEIYTQVGISVQPHASYKFNCVQVFGSNIHDKNNLEV